MRKKRKNEKKTAVAWSLKYTTYPVRLVIKHLFWVRIGYVGFFGPPEAGMGGGAGRWSGAHTQRFSFLLRFLGLPTPDFLMFLYH